MLHPHRLGRRFAAVALAFGLLATGCGADPVTDSTEAPPSPHVVDGQAMLDRTIAGLVRINGPYVTSTTEASVAEASLVPPGLIGINGPYNDERAEEVPANAR